MVRDCALTQCGWVCVGICRRCMLSRVSLSIVPEVVNAVLCVFLSFFFFFFFFSPMVSTLLIFCSPISSILLPISDLSSVIWLLLLFWEPVQQERAGKRSGGEGGRMKKQQQDLWRWRYKLIDKWTKSRLPENACYTRKESYRPYIATHWTSSFSLLLLYSFSFWLILSKSRISARFSKKMNVTCHLLWSCDSTNGGNDQVDREVDVRFKRPYSLSVCAIWQHALPGCVQEMLFLQLPFGLW